MKKLTSIIAILMVMLSTSAFAQIDTTSTAYGVKLQNNRNLRFTKTEKVHTEISFGGHYSSGDVDAYGIDLSASRVYTPSKSFAWNWGGLASVDYNADFGAQASFMGKAGVRFGNSVSFGVDGLAGIGQMSLYDFATNGVDKSHHYSSLWRPTVGAQASVNFKLSENLGLSLFGRYTYFFNDENGRTSRTEPEGWTAEPTEYHTSKWSVGASLTFNINTERQVSGDNCWHTGLYSGYSFEGNKGVIAGAELYHTKRVSAKGARVLGIGTEMTFGENDTQTNFTFGKIGYQILPIGADSPWVFEFGAKAGLGEYAKTRAASTDNESYSFNASNYSPAVVGKVYASVNWHLGRVNIKAGVEGGYHTCFGSNFESATSNFEGTTSKKHGADYGAFASVSFAL